MGREIIQKRVKMKKREVKRSTKENNLLQSPQHGPSGGGSKTLLEFL